MELMSRKTLIIIIIAAIAVLSLIGITAAATLFQKTVTVNVLDIITDVSGNTTVDVYRGMSTTEVYTITTKSDITLDITPITSDPLLTAVLSQSTIYCPGNTPTAFEALITAPESLTPGAYTIDFYFAESVL